MEVSNIRTYIHTKFKQLRLNNADKKLRVFTAIFSNGNRMQIPCPPSYEHLPVIKAAECQARVEKEMDKTPILTIPIGKGQVIEAHPTPMEELEKDMEEEKE